MIGDQLKQADIHKIAEEGGRIYAEMKSRYEPQERGKYLAIEIESRSAYLGATSTEVLAQARERHPNKVFFVLKIGYDAAETIAASLFRNPSNG